MDQEKMDKMDAMMQPCSCGSGMMAGKCHMKDEADAMMNEMCPCGSGKMAKECHMAAMMA